MIILKHYSLLTSIFQCYYQIRMKTSPFRSIILFLLLFLIIAIVFSPVLYFNYLYHDDATFWVKFKELGFKHIYFDICITECRYGDALLLSIENFFVHKVADLKFLRFLGVLISSCNAYLLLLQMRRLSFSDIQAILIIPAIFFLPGFEDILGCGEYAPIIALSIFLASWSFYRIETGRGMALPFLSFFFALTVYPPAAMFYWTMLGMYILFVRDRRTPAFKVITIRSMTVGLTGILIFAIIIFLMHFSLAHKTISALYNPFVISQDWRGKLSWFFQEPLENALNLWNIFPKTAVSAAISGFIALTLLVIFIKNPKGSGRLRFAAVFIFVLFLTFLPNLAASENAAFYRCLIPLTSLIWLLLVWCIFQWMDIIPTLMTRWSVLALLCTILVYAGITACHNVLYYRVFPSYVEWNAYKFMAQEIQLKKVDAIHVVFPYHFPVERYDEFGTLSSDYITDIFHLIYCAFQETGGQKQILTSIIVSFPEDNQLYEEKEIYVKRLPDGQWLGKDLNGDGSFMKIDRSVLGDTSDNKLVYFAYPFKSSKRENWYTLNLNDILSPSN